MTRRSILSLPLAAAAAAALPGCEPAAEPRAVRPSRPTGKAILVLGGTHFLGPPLVETARAHGHTVTLFNRGKTNPQLFPDVEKLHGDRNGDLAVLRGRRWDAVIDTSGQLPRQVRSAATLLRDAVQQYVFISSISVYEGITKPGADETAKVAVLADPNDDHWSVERYGGLKAHCEKTAEEIMPGRVTVVRPGLIVGPRDDTDRFTYWPARVARGGEVLAPGAPTDPAQLVDVRDLGAWLVHLVERATMGVYNAVTNPIPFGALLDACGAGGGGVKLTWADAKFLEEQKVTPWQDMPVWIPPAGEDGGMAQLSNARAVQNGLTFRPVAETARDTLAWFRTLPPERQAKLRAGITPKREAEVLAAWHRR